MHRPAGRHVAAVLVLASVATAWVVGRSAFGTDDTIGAWSTPTLVSFSGYEARFLVALVTVQAILVVAALGLASPKAVGPFRAALRDMMERPRRAYAALSLVGASTAFAIALLGTGFHTASEDEKTYIFQAELLRLGHLTIPVAPEGDYFAAPFFVMHAGRWSGQYFWGQPALIALASLLGSPWIAAIAELALTIGLSGLAAARFFRSERVGVLTAALLATSPLLVINGATLLNVNLAATCIAASLWAVSVLRDERSATATWVLGISTSVALHNRPLDHAAVIVPVAVLLLLETGRTKRETVARFLPAILIALPFLALHPILNVAISGDPWRNGYSMFNNDHGWKTMGFGVGPMGDVQTVVTASAKTIANMARVSIVATGCPVLVAVAAVATVVAPSRTSAMRAAALLVVGAFYGAYFFYESAPATIAGPVYYVSVASVVCAWIAASIVELDARAQKVEGGATWFPALLVVTWAVAVGTAWPPFIRELHRGATLCPDARATNLAEKYDLHHALVFVAVAPTPKATWERQLPYPHPRFDDDVLYVHAFDGAINARIAEAFGAGRSFYFMNQDITSISHFDPVSGALAPIPAPP